MQFTLALSIALVVLVIFLFLKSLPATVIPSLAVPVSVIVTFAAMYLMGFSVNNMTLLALTLCVGFVVDDAIVMLENIMRHIEEGMKPFEAALVGAREIGFHHFVHHLLAGRRVHSRPAHGRCCGRIFREFAITISVAILVSGFVSLTLTTPMLCARMLKEPDHNKRHNFILRWFEAGFEAVTTAYRVSLGWVMKARLLMLAITFASLGLSVYMFQTIQKGFFPSRIPASSSP